jgi:glycosyltransferase involved in cell wall biosynthesis
LPRILQIIPTLVRGGAEKQLTLLATGLARKGWDMHVCVLTHTGLLEEELRKAGVPLTFIDKRWKLDPFAYLRLKREIQRLQPDLVHTWLFAANAYGRQAAFAAGVKHVVAGERCVDPWKGALQLTIDRYLATRTERIVTNSGGVRDFYAGKGIPAEKFTVIPNGIAPFAPPPEQAVTREQLLGELGLSQDARLVGAIGRLWPQKRLKDVIWGADLIQCVRDDVHFLMIGDGPLRRRLERFAEQCYVAERVHFLGERSDIPRILPHLDLLMLASSYEGQSNAIMEAMSAGVPVVASDIPGNRDLVINGETGLLVDIGDRAGLAQKALMILADADLAKRLGSAGRERMLRDFSIEKMVERHEELYRTLCGQ